ncbi:MAG: hypothetical protein H7248_09795 [Microbacteriaceae bacterium]|nr:hypothetical protein [Microbacteriaceae bacterium]
MHVSLNLVLDCDPDAAWRFIRSPAGLTQASRPFMSFASREEEGFPEVWPAGDHAVSVKALGRIPLGRQRIRISYPRGQRGARVVRDTGGGISGIFTLVHHWDHSMSVASAPQGKTIYRDRLDFRAGFITPLLWLSYWLFWQWRGLAIRRATHRR